MLLGHSSIQVHSQDYFYSSPKCYLISYTYLQHCFLRQWRRLNCSFPHINLALSNFSGFKSGCPQQSPTCVVFCTPQMWFWPHWPQIPCSIQEGSIPNPLGSQGAEGENSRNVLVGAPWAAAAELSLSPAEEHYWWNTAPETCSSPLGTRTANPQTDFIEHQIRKRKLRGKWNFPIYSNLQEWNWCHCR